jgi:hypothetical protein
METLTTPPTTPPATPATSEPEKPGVWETIELKADEFEDVLEHVVREGAVRRIVVREDGEVIAEFPLALGVIGAVLAAPLAAIAAIVALLGDCTIEVERRRPDDEAAASDARADEAGEASEADEAGEASEAVEAVEAVEPHAAVTPA